MDVNCVTSKIRTATGSTDVIQAISLIDKSLRFGNTVVQRFTAPQGLVPSRFG
jgi:hypothetical protein